MGSSDAVLIVEDEASNRQALALALEDLPCRVDVAEDGERALRLLAEREYAVVIADKNLPDFGGVDLIRVARARPHPPACMVITGFGSVETALEALELGACGYYEKPLADV